LSLLYSPNIFLAIINELFSTLPLTFGACIGADFGWRSCQAIACLNGNVRIRGWRTTEPDLQYVLYYAVVFCFF
jgi:hypothetical protein